MILRNHMPKKIRVALVCMPWCSITIAPLSLAVLKSHLAADNFSSDVIHLHIRFAEQIGFSLYERIAIRSALYPEWFFSSILFKGHGCDGFQNDLASLDKTKEGRQFIDELARQTCGTIEECGKLRREAERFIDVSLTSIDWSHFDVVGFTVTHAQICSSLLMAKRLKSAFPGVQVVLGGASAQGEMGYELLKSFKWIDFVVHGEGERALVMLLKNISDGTDQNIPGVSMRDGERIVRNDHTLQSPFPMTESRSPNHDEYFAEVQRTGLDRKMPISLSVESSRGCWWGSKHLCTFCGLNGTALAYRAKPADCFYNEILALSAQYKWLSFLACDTILDMKYFRDLLPRLAGSDFNISFFFEIKPNLSRTQVALLRDAGITRIQPGLEALDTNLLNLMRKGATAFQNLAFLKWCREFGINAFWNILHGFPGETVDNFAKYPTIMRLIFHLQPPVDVCPITFERFSPYHLDPASFGLALHASSVYDFLFPPFVNQGSLAYFFDAHELRQSSHASNTDLDACLHDIRSTFSEWRDLWKSQAVSFYYEKGPTFVILHDNRPLKPGASTSRRRIVLEGTAADVFIFCEEPHTLAAIIAHVLMESCDRDTVVPRVHKILASFVSEGLMYQENDRYLSLAVRKGGVPSANHVVSRRESELTVIA